MFVSLPRVSFQPIVLLIAVVLFTGLVGCASPGVTARATMALYQADGKHKVRYDSVDLEYFIQSHQLELYKEEQRLNSGRTLQALIEHEAVRSTSWYSEFGSDSEAALGALRDWVLSTRRIPDTLTVELEVTARTAGDALSILDAWIHVYRQAAKNAELERAHLNRIASQRQLEATIAQIQTVESQIRRHLADHPRPPLADQDVIGQELLFLDAKRREISELFGTARAAYAQMQAADAPGYEPTESEAERIHASPAMLRLDVQIEELVTRREAELDGGRAETDAVIQRFDSAIRHFQVDQSVEFDRQARTLFSAKVEMATQAIAIYEEQLEMFAPRIEELRSILESQRQQAIEFQAFATELESLEQRREEQRQSLSELETYIRHQNPFRLHLISTPTIIEP